MTAIKKDVCIQGPLDEGLREDTTGVGYEQGSLRVSQKTERAQDGMGRAFIVVPMEELERRGLGSKLVWVVGRSLTIF